MANIWLYSLASVFAVSLISFTGVFTLSLKTKKLKKILLYLVSFSTGAILGNVFLNLLPETVEMSGFGIDISIYILSGILFSFLIEKVIHWRHYHKTEDKKHIHSFSYLLLLGDGVHNFIDGMVLGAVYLADIAAGIATTISIIFHEIPQEIGDFAVLLHGGLTKKRALFYNFLSAITSIIGTVLVLALGSSIKSVVLFLIPFAAGNFVYIAAADLIPELHKEIDLKKSFLQSVFLLAGIMVMLVLKLVFA